MSSAVTAWFETYLSSRAIDLDVAKSLGVRLAYPDEIDAILDRDNGAKMEAAIFIPFGVDACRLRPYRPPVYIKKDVYDAAKIATKLYDCPGNEAFEGTWRKQADGTVPQEPGTYVFGGRLVKRHTDGKLAQEKFYPLKVPKSLAASVEVEKFTG